MKRTVFWVILVCVACDMHANMNNYASKFKNLPLVTKKDASKHTRRVDRYKNIGFKYDSKLVQTFLLDLKKNPMIYTVENAIWKSKRIGSDQKTIVVWGIPFEGPPILIAVVPPKGKAELKIPSALSKLYIIDETTAQSGAMQSAQKGVASFENYIKGVPKEQWAVLNYEDSLQRVFSRPHTVPLQFLRAIANRIGNSGGLIKDGFTVSTYGNDSLQVKSNTVGFWQWMAKIWQFDYLDPSAR
ncbi:MAG: hypothetical protein WD055_03985 [Candidatus Dependentiae bacterium]